MPGDLHGADGRAGRNQPVHRSHVTAAAAARRLCAALLATPPPTGRRRGVATATQETRVALAVLSLTFGYSKRTDTPSLSQLAGMTGYRTQTIGRVLTRLHRAKLVTYRPANAHQGRRFGSVTLPAGADAQDLPPAGPRAGIVAAATWTRALVQTVLDGPASLATARLALALISEIPTWLRTTYAVDCGHLAQLTGLDPKTIGRKLKDLAAAGVLAYTPGRGRGRHGHLDLPVTPPAAPSPTARAARATPAREQLTDAQKDRANHAFGWIFETLTAQDPDIAAEVLDVLGSGKMKSRDRFARMLDALVLAGYEAAAHDALTRLPFPGARHAYQGVEDLPSVLFKKLERCYLATPDAVRGSVGVDVTELLTDGMAQIRTGWAAIVPDGFDAVGAHSPSRA